jgi:hypothetical protein
MTDPPVVASRPRSVPAVPAAVHKVHVLMALFDKQLSDDAVLRMSADPWVLLAQLQYLAPFLGWLGGDFTASRPLSRQQRADMGITMPRRRYRHLVRQIRQTQQHAARMQEQVLLRQLRLVGYSGMAYSIQLEEMREDPYGAAFVAYWVSQHNRARAALVTEEEPFDLVAQMLMRRCTASPATNWWMVARACPLPPVLARVSDQQRGELMAQWMQFMRLAADRMNTMTRQDRWPVGFDDTAMVARPGMDWSTWNTLADCYNQARAGWISCLAAAGSLRLLNAVCPGKAMPLLCDGQPAAAGEQERRVWAALPKPWQVLDGTSCTGRTVELACQQHGIDPRATGWTVPRTADPRPWVPSVGLVRGIQTGDPAWAGVLAAAGVFTGPNAGHSDLLTGTQPGEPGVSLDQEVQGPAWT